MQIDNAAIARQLGYSKEEMIAKFGNPGEKSPTEIGNALGLSNSTVSSVFGTPQNNASSKDNSDYSVWDLASDFVNGKGDDDIAEALGFTKEEMEAMFGKPGETDPSEIGSQLGLGTDEIENIFGSYQTTIEDTDDETTDDTTDETTEDEATDNTQKTQDDKYKEVADALGYDKKSVSAIMKAIANEVSGRPEEVVPKLAYDLGLPQQIVSDVLKYLNNGNI